MFIFCHFVPDNDDKAESWRGENKNSIFFSCLCQRQNDKERLRCKTLPQSWQGLKQHIHNLHRGMKHWKEWKTFGDMV